MAAPSRRGREAASRGRSPARMAQTPVRLPFHWSAIDPAVRREIVYHHAADGVPLSGILYLPPSREPGTAVLAMHPRGDFTRHYLAPKLAAAGYAFLGTTTRYLNNDADALHERLLLRRPARQLGRRVAVRLLPRAGREARGGAPRARAVGRPGGARRGRHAGG